MRLKHRSLLGITILTILTFGIYHIYWYFITKTEMNVINGKTIKVPFFLWFFIPVINIWWYWRFAKAIEKITKENVNRWAAFIAPLVLSVLAGLFLIVIFGPNNDGGIFTPSRFVYSLAVIVASLLPIYYFQSNLNKYAK
jgi:hypothetical protein